MKRRLSPEASDMGRHRRSILTEKRRARKWEVLKKYGYLDRTGKEDDDTIM